MDIIERYLEEVLVANETTNLTRIVSRESAKILHIEDSTSGLNYINEAPGGPYVDLGTGGGFPGVPLAVKTGRDTLLVDSVKKKTAIIQGIVDKLGISNVSTYAGRIEDLGREMPSHFAVATARALSQLPSLMELASPLLFEGGLLICYKSHLSNEERNHALSLEDKLGLKCIHEDTFTLSDGETTRCMFVMQKFKDAEVKLPRKTGLAQKRPLK